MIRRALVLLLDEAAPSFCYYDVPERVGGDARPMPLETVDRALAFAAARGLAVQVLAPLGGVPAPVRERLSRVDDHVCYVPAAGGGLEAGDVPIVDLVGDEDHRRLPDLAAGHHPVAILRVGRRQLARWPAAWHDLAARVPRVVLVLVGVDRYEASDLERYAVTLAEARRQLVSCYAAGRMLELSALSDRLALAEPLECGAGLDHLTVTPGGALQICPGFALADEPAVGTLAGEPRIPNRQLLGRDQAPICAPCDAFQCRRCVHLNRRATGELNTPPWQLCRAAHLEREATRALSEQLRARGLLPGLPRIDAVAYEDPAEQLTPRAAPGATRTVVLFVSEQCNLRCRYCYVLHKAPRRRMSFEVARAAVDHLLSRRDLFAEPSVSWMFFGGEPLLEAPLIERVIGYINQRTAELDHPWRHERTFWAPSNGTLYHTAAAQRLVRGCGLEVRITIDGPRRIHDRQRVYPDGRGSYDDVLANLPLWLSQHAAPRTNLTLTHESLPALAESVLHLFALGVRGVRAKTVFEDVWQPGDAEIYEQQLGALADEMLARELWRDHDCFLLRRDVAHPDPTRRWCTAGVATIGVDVDGELHPCQRFMACALGQRPARTLGNVRRGGLDPNRVRPFLGATAAARSPLGCASCADAASCDTCLAHDYDIADSPTIYQRATHVCRMHRARARVNRRFWAEVDRAEAKTTGEDPQQR